ncbi:hypothetical protein [Lysinibacillus sphaericus]|uniref:Uncharacterized protein n=1 Tax=Lysinibacillus sphaericus OT4b.31 TaxID=1285586 RepID=R7ZK76_LYSSH|nr:hypothetical protein [Lysinibacillus sphaericus]EON74488.1 hypothetical protein H131_01325 [Lysinibacillus sphaericus OT4b.31]
MKISSKLLSIFCSITLILTLFFINVTESSASELDADVNSGLAEGEVVVDFTDVVLDDELIGTEVPFEEEISPFEITPFERQLMWFGTSSTYEGLTYGPWNYAGASTVSGGSLSASHTKTVAHKYSGTLKIPVKKLESVVGFDVTLSWSESVSYRSKTYDSGNYRLEYRHVYKKYKVTQEQKYDSRGKTYDTKYVYPEQWVERQYRVVQF